MKIFIVIATLLLIGAGAAFADLRKNFVAFDKAFIPPLALTNQEKLKPSEKAMKILEKEWSEFKAKYYDYNPKDAQWKSDFDEADKLIREAGDVVRSGKNLFSAHETLEGIRILFMELRKRNRIDYYIDLLTEFHEHMEFIFHAGKENTPASLTDEDIKSVKITLSEAEEVWGRIKTARFDKELYDFDDRKVTEMQHYIDLETAALNKLKMSIQNLDKPSIIKTAMAIRPNYAKLYKMLGDFDRMEK